MIEKFVRKWEEKKYLIRAKFEKEHPDCYQSIVRAVVEILGCEDEYESPDPERIHLIDDGDYQGSLVFVIACYGYQPSKYWSVIVNYGSCSGCDTLEEIRQYNVGIPDQEQVDQYMILALHIVQGLESMNREESHHD